MSAGLVPEGGFRPRQQCFCAISANRHALEQCPSQRCPGPPEKFSPFLFQTRSSRMVTRFPWDSPHPTIVFLAARVFFCCVPVMFWVTHFSWIVANGFLPDATHACPLAHGGWNPFVRTHTSHVNGTAQMRAAEWTLGKWQQLKPAVPWWFNFDPYPYSKFANSFCGLRGPIQCGCMAPEAKPSRSTCLARADGARRRLRRLRRLPLAEKNILFIF